MLLLNRTSRFCPGLTLMSVWTRSLLLLLAIDVNNCPSVPGDVPVTPDAYVIGEGVGAARKASV